MLETFETQIARNKRRSTLLMLVLVVFSGVVGFIFGGAAGQSAEAAIACGLFAFVLGSISTIVGYFQGSEIIMSASGARLITHADDPELFNVVEEMAIAAGVPLPNVYLIDDTAMNAFATGRSPEKAAIAMTTGLRNRLTRDELQSVIAHEMGHIVNYDTRLMMITAAVAGIVVLLCDMFWYMPRRNRSNDGGSNPLFLVIGLFLAILAPVIAKLLQLAVSREREYLADSTAVRLARNPLALASALRKLVSDTEVLEAANRATEHLYIVSPTHKLAEANWDSAWATHPPIEKRIARIEALTL